MSIKVPYGAAVASFHGNVAALKSAGLGALQGLNKALQTQYLDSKGVHFSGNGPGVPLGQSGGTFTAKEILYHRLRVDETTYACDYLAGSGIYVASGGSINPQGLQNFLDAIQLGDPSDSGLTRTLDLHNQPMGAPSIVVWHQCCVIIDLVSNNFQFRVNPANPALQAVDTVYDCQKYYTDLKHIDTTGAPYGAGSNACQRIYFSVVAPSATAGDDRIDQFNIYLQINHPTRVDFVTLDPFIKNRGGH